MAEAQVEKTLSEQYLLKGNEGKSETVTKPVEETVETPSEPSSGEVVSEKAEETPVAPSEEKSETPAAAEEIIEAPAAAASEDNSAPAPAEENSETPEEESSGDQEASEDEPEMKLETAPADFRFPTTNQTRHCFTRYIEYHRCVAAKGEDAFECDRFAKYYRSLCPGEWLVRMEDRRSRLTASGRSRAQQGGEDTRRRKRRPARSPSPSEESTSDTDRTQGHGVASVPLSHPPPPAPGSSSAAPEIDPHRDHQTGIVRDLL